MKMKELDKINTDNEAKTEVREEVVNILAEEEIKISTKVGDATIKTKMKNCKYW